MKNNDLTQHEIRERIFAMIFCNEFRNEDEMPEQLAFYLENFDDMTAINREKIRSKASDVIAKKDELDNKINSVAKGWKTSRMSKVDLSIIRLALYEILFEDDIPNVVSINEAVELAKSYGGNSSPSFINGILARLV